MVTPPPTRSTNALWPTARFRTLLTRRSIGVARGRPPAAAITGRSSGGGGSRLRPRPTVAFNQAHGRRSPSSGWHSPVRGQQLLRAQAITEPRTARSGRKSLAAPVLTNGSNERAPAPGHGTARQQLNPQCQQPPGSSPPRHTGLHYTTPPPRPRTRHSAPRRLESRTRTPAASALPQCRTTTFPAPNRAPPESAPPPRAADNPTQRPRPTQSRGSQAVRSEAGSRIPVQPRSDRSRTQAGTDAKLKNPHSPKPRPIAPEAPPQSKPRVGTGAQRSPEPRPGRIEAVPQTGSDAQRMSRTSPKAAGRNRCAAKPGAASPPNPGLTGAATNPGQPKPRRKREAARKPEATRSGNGQRVCSSQDAYSRA
jgi:hypothetical protein